jgi:hypothetical protein
MCEASAFDPVTRIGATRIVIFKLLSDLLDISAAETEGRVNKTGIVESVVGQASGSFLSELPAAFHESKVVIHKKCNILEGVLFGTSVLTAALWDPLL